MRRLRNLLFVACCMAAPSIGMSGTMNNLKVECESGEVLLFPLEKEPLVTLSSNSLKISCEDSVYVQEISKVKSWGYVELHTGVIETPAGKVYNVIVSHNSATVTSSQLKSLRLFGINGSLLGVARAVDGEATISLTSVPQGTYILQINEETSVKILKK